MRLAMTLVIENPLGLNGEAERTEISERLPQVYLLVTRRGIGISGAFTVPSESQSGEARCKFRNEEYI